MHRHGSDDESQHGPLSRGSSTEPAASAASSGSRPLASACTVDGIPLSAAAQRLLGSDAACPRIGLLGAVQARTRRSGEERVTPLELFFDLDLRLRDHPGDGVWSRHPTWAGLVQGLLVLGVLWWAWAAYAWLTNTINPEEGVVRLAMFGAMAAMLIASLAVPDVFGDDAFLFACAYALVRIAHLVLYAVAGRGDRDLLGAVARLAPGTAVVITLALRGRRPRRQGAGGGLGGGAAGRPAGCVHRRRPRLASRAQSLRGAPRPDRDHRARRVDRRARAPARRPPRRGRRSRLRCSASRSLPRSGGPTSTSSRSSPSGSCARRTGNAQLTMARDSYSYLHLPMVAGIILFAVGVKKTLGDVGEPLKLIPAVALCGGVALYLVAHVLFRLRNVHTFNRHRSIVSVLLLALIPRRRSSCLRSRRWGSSRHSASG